jgi:hypothetical protein
MKRILLALLVLVLVGGGYYYYKFLRNTPVSALMQAARATQTHDVATFERFVDVEALTGGVVDDIASNSSLLSAVVPGGGFMLRSGIGLLKPQLAKAAHSEVQRYVETGSLEAAIAAAPKRTVNISFLGLMGRMIGPGSSFKGIKYTTEQGDEARVGIEFTQPRYDTTMVAEVLLKRQPDGHWQAKRISNTGEMLRQVAHQEKQHLLN